MYQNMRQICDCLSSCSSFCLLQPLMVRSLERKNDGAVSVNTGLKLCARVVDLLFHTFFAVVAVVEISSECASICGQHEIKPRSF